jgi:hypothetical protein
MNSNEKSFNYKVLNLVKHYNFGIRCISIRNCLNFFLKSESQNMLNFKTNVWDTKKLEIKSLSTENM